MDIQAEKIELVKLLLNEDDPDVISDVRSILNHKDFYDDLPDHVKEDIRQGLEDVKNGDVTPHEEVMRNFEQKYGIKG